MYRETLITGNGQSHCVRNLKVYGGEHCAAAGGTFALHIVDERGRMKARVVLDGAACEALGNFLFIDPDPNEETTP